MTEQTHDPEVHDESEGPDLNHDELLGTIQRQSADEYERASDASESGARLKEFLEETGMNSQAFGWLKAIYKKLPKKDGEAKAMDIIRSLEKGLPMVKSHVLGQATAEMDFDAPEGDAAEAASEEELAADTDEFEEHAAKLGADDEDQKVVGFQ